MSKCPQPDREVALVGVTAPAACRLPAPLPICQFPAFSICLCRHEHREWAGENERGKPKPMAVASCCAEARHNWALGTCARRGEEALTELPRATSSRPTRAILVIFFIFSTCGGRKSSKTRLATEPRNRPKLCFA